MPGQRPGIFYMSLYHDFERLLWNSKLNLMATVAKRIILSAHCLKIFCFKMRF